MIPFLAANAKAWQELLDAISDRFSWFVQSGVWMILGVLLGAAIIFLSLYAVMRHYTTRRSDSGNLW
jgi:predicted permease